MVRPRPTLIEAIKARVAREDDGCLVWQGDTLNGYPRLGLDGRELLVRRIIAAAAYGELNANQEVGSVCGRRDCIAPSYLKVRTRRGRPRKPWCLRGHSLIDPANVRLTAPGRRVCRACDRLRHARRAQPAG